MKRKRRHLRLVRAAELGGADCGCGLGDVPSDPARLQAEVAALAERYDAASPTVSFSRWAAEQGQGALVDAYKALLRAAGDTEVIAALDATPPPPPESPEQRIAKFDAPPHGGPWALDANGNWFQVTHPAPGSEVIEVDGRSIYIPAEHPSVRVKENQYGAGEAHRKRWTEQKFRAANKAMLGADPFHTLFFKVAPRGGWGGGQGFGRAFEGTADDYDHEGGELYPNLGPGAEAEALKDWYYRNSFDNRYGYDRGLTLNWLRAYTDSEGYRRYKAFSDSEFRDFANRWHMAGPGYVCGGDEVQEIAHVSAQRQRERQAAQTERDYSVHWPWILGPLAQCEPTSSSRRRKNLKKAAAVAAVVVGAVFLGPAVAGAIKGAAAKGGVLAKIGAAAGKIMPKVVDGVNAARSIKAIKDGEVPPPPIKLEGSRFVDYASAIGTNLIERELHEQGQRVADAERRLIEEQMAQQVRALQQSALRELPGSVPTSTLPLVSPAVRSAMESPPVDFVKVAAIAGGVLLVGLMLSR
jgi:hypothetical protein